MWLRYKKNLWELKKINKNSPVILLFGLMLLAGIFSCAINPVSKKQQFVLMSEEQELAIGRRMDPQIIKEYGLYNDPELQDYVDMVGQKIAAKSDRPELFYHFKVLNSPVINAFALPGGYIYITRGILAQLNNESELAGVLGHEVGHVTARHAVQQYTQSQSYQVLATFANIFVPVFRSRELQQLADIAATGIIRGYGRKMEMESDELGIKYSYQANYNPNAVPDFLTILKLVSKGKKEGSFHGLFATHPDTTARIKAAKFKAGNLRKTKESAYPISYSERYLSKIEGLVYGNDPAGGVIQGRLFQHPVLQFEITYPEGWKIYNTKSSVISKEKEKDEKYTSQLIMETLGKRITPAMYAKNFFKQNNIKPISAYATEINGLETYIAIFEKKNRESILLKIMSSFILKQDKIFLLSGFSKIEDFNQGEKYFNQIIHSFRGLSKSEAASIKAERIKIYTVQDGDTLKSIAKKYNKDPQKIALINGFEKDDISLETGKKIKVLANYTHHN